MLAAGIACLESQAGSASWGSLFATLREWREFCFRRFVLGNVKLSCAARSGDKVLEPVDASLRK